LAFRFDYKATDPADEARGNNPSGFVRLSSNFCAFCLINRVLSESLIYIEVEARQAVKQSLEIIRRFAVVKRIANRLADYFDYMDG